MHVFSLNAFSRLVGERPKTVKNLVRQGSIKRVIKRCDRLEFEADAALDYLAEKHPQLIASKSELNTLRKRCSEEQIVKEEKEERIVKNGGERGRYLSKLS